MGETRSLLTAVDILLADLSELRITSNDEAMTSNSQYTTMALYEEELVTFKTLLKDFQYAENLATMQEAEDQVPRNFRRLLGEAYRSMCKKLVGQAKCISCGEVDLDYNFHKMKKCKHSFCSGCLGRLFILASKDESLLPVSCCGKPIKLQLAHQILPPDDLKTLFKAILERDTPSNLRLYCPVPTCSTFIPLTETTSITVHCPTCTCQVCLRCKQRAHGMTTCPVDASAVSFETYARKQRLQRCRRCSKYVELESGCYHMTCKCSHQFCYLCGVQWKKCACPRWDEDRLLSSRGNA